MEAFLERSNLDINLECLKGSVRDCARRAFPEECCGLIVNKDGVKSVEELKNLSRLPRTSFLIDAYEMLGKDVCCIYHSHPEGSAEASIPDKTYCNEVRIPFLIYGFKDDDFSLLMPEEDCVIDEGAR